jgi:hypothetical protein
MSSIYEWNGYKHNETRRCDRSTPGREEKAEAGREEKDETGWESDASDSTAAAVCGLPVVVVQSTAAVASVACVADVLGFRVSGF